jgi:NCS1 family nucleobase:cation symporter-1
LGSIAGVMIADYYLVRRRDLDLNDLYREEGRYTYRAGVNWRAVIAMGIGIAPNIPGFLAQASGGSVAVPAVFAEIYTYAWFVSLLVSGLVYAVLMRSNPAGSASSSENPGPGLH